MRNTLAELQVNDVELMPLDSAVRLYFDSDESQTFDLLDVANISLPYIHHAAVNPENYRYFEDSQGYLVITRKETVHA